MRDQLMNGVVCEPAAEFDYEIGKSIEVSIFSDEVISPHSSSQLPSFQ